MGGLCITVHLWCSRLASGLKWGSMGGSGLLTGTVVGLQCSGLLAGMVMGCSRLLAGAVMGHSQLLAGVVMGCSGWLAGGFVGSCGAMDGDSGLDLVDLATVGLVLVLFIILAFFIILLIILILIILIIILLILASSVGWLGGLEIRLALTC